MISEVIPASGSQNLPPLITQAELKPEGHRVRLTIQELWLNNVWKSLRLMLRESRSREDWYDNDVVKRDCHRSETWDLQNNNVTLSVSVTLGEKTAANSLYSHKSSCVNRMRVVKQVKRTGHFRRWTVRSVPRGGGDQTGTEEFKCWFHHHPPWAENIDLNKDGWHILPLYKKME